MVLTRLFRMSAALLAVLVVAEVAVRFLDGGLPEPVTWYHEIAQAKTEQMEQHEGELDLIFAGTSQSYHAIDPEVIDARLGTRSYNAGIPAGIPTVQRRWLFDAVVPNLEVDTVVWAISSVDMNAARPQSMTPVYESSFMTRKGILADVDRWLSDRLAIFRHRRDLVDPRSWAADEDPVDQARSVLYPSGKRQPGSPNLSDAERERIRRNVIGDFEVGGRMSQAIRETVEELRARDIDVVLVWLPEAPRYRQLLPDRSLQQRARLEAARAARALGVPMLDVSDGFDDDDFIDFTHLDGDASRRLSTRLATMLARSPAAA
jgi:hypothetical protein